MVYKPGCWLPAVVVGVVCWPAGGPRLYLPHQQLCGELVHTAAYVEAAVGEALVVCGLCSHSSDLAHVTRLLLELPDCQLLDGLTLLDHTSRQLHSMTQRHGRSLRYSHVSKAHKDVTTPQGRKRALPSACCMSVCCQQTEPTSSTKVRRGGLHWAITTSESG